MGPDAGSGSAICSQEVASAVQPCMQKDYAGNRAACMREAVGENAPAVCVNKWLRCEGLRSLTKFLQLAEAVSGCSNQHSTPACCQPQRSNWYRPGWWK